MQNRSSLLSHLICGALGFTFTLAAANAGLARLLDACIIAMQ
ncbi:hypothetical protein [Ensifer soli]